MLLDGLGDAEVADALQRLYATTSLAAIGYPHWTAVERLMKNTRNAGLYRVLVASRHPLGIDLFRKVAQIEPAGQRRLGFD
jgi:hypothetical protein